jgi:hypothetical protein
MRHFLTLLPGARCGNGCLQDCGDVFLTYEVIKDGAHLLLNPMRDGVGSKTNGAQQTILVWAGSVALERWKFGNAFNDLCVDCIH